MYEYKNEPRITARDDASLLLACFTLFLMRMHDSATLSGALLWHGEIDRQLVKVKGEWSSHGYF